jgi:hypothetical protein
MQHHNATQKSHLPPQPMVLKERIEVCSVTDHFKKKKTRKLNEGLKRPPAKCRQKITL